MNKRTSPVSNRGPASLLDILGATNRNGKIAAAWKVHHKQLVDLRDQLEGHKGQLRASAQEAIPSSGGLHMGDAGTDQYDADFALSMLSSDQNALYEIEEALSRIRNGTYGVCELTGQPIEAERLEYIPWTRFSAEAQRQIEKDGGGYRTRFGQRQYLDQTTPADEDEEEETNSPA